MVKLIQAIQITPQGKIYTQICFFEIYLDQHSTEHSHATNRQNF